MDNIALPLLSTELVEEFQEQRNIIIASEISSELALRIMLLLRHLDNISHDPIYFYINSGGGSVSAGFTIIDNMRLIKSPVYTITYGMAASMAAVIFAAGEPGHRYVLPHSEIMIHQPWSYVGESMKQSDLEVASRHMTRTRTRIEELLSKCSGKSIREIHKACDYDNYLTAEEAVALGLADKILNAK